MLKKIALAVMIVCGAATAQNVTAPATLEPGQMYNTGNIVQQTTTTSGSTWVNGVYQDQLTCWVWGNPGYCGPNPIVRPGNNINFSFGWTDLYQQQAIASVLPSSGTGLRVNGYNFSFNAKNGNGWDDGRTDLLFAYVQFNDLQGNSVLNHTHNLSYKFNWSTFNYSKTFDSPFAANDLGTVRYGFVGRDNNGWAGPYGPEITNVSFGLNYSVDPCIKDPLYSPTCPGYMDALNKLLPPPVVVEPVATASPVAATTTVAEVVIAPATLSVSTAPLSQPSVVAPVVSAPAPVATSSSSSTTSSASSSTNNREGSGANTSQALNIISRNQERDRETLSVAQSAVSAAAAAASSAQQEAQSVAANAVSNSTTANAATTNNQQSSGAGIRANANNSNFTLQSGLVNSMSISGTQSPSNMLVQQQNNTNTGIIVNNNQPATSINLGSQQSTINIATYALPLLQPQQNQNLQTVSAPVQTESTTQTQTIPQSNKISQNIETYSIIAPNFLTDRSSPLTDIIENKQNIPQNSTIATTGASVNKNASDSEIASGVDINRMALAPVGYNSYLNFTLRDATFYAPREVYVNQRNIDNQRVLRQLTNDSKHKEMVEMQYVR